MHERGALAVERLVLFVRLLSGDVVVGRLQRYERCLELLIPLRALLRELRVANAFHRGNKGDAVPDEEVEFAVAIDVGDPDARRMRRTGQVALAEQLAVLDRFPRLDQRSKWLKVRHLALAGLVPRPVDAAVAGAAHQVEGPVAV